MKPSMSLKQVKDIAASESTSSSKEAEMMKLILALAENLESLIRQLNAHYKP